MQQEENKYPEVYTEQEMEIIKKHIETHFGKFETIIHDVVSTDIHVDICLINPTKERNFYTLVTLGMGAHKMKIPKAFREQNIAFAELLITLPADWKIDSRDERDYWPIRLLTMMARYPITNQTWIAWGHIVPNGEPFADNTRLSNIGFQYPYPFGKESFVSILPNDKPIHFYQMIPLYDEEVDFKNENGAEGLESRMGSQFSHVVDCNRENYCVLNEKKWVLSKEQLKVLYEGEGPQGCLATDRILIDGCRVGYMYRERPDKNSDMPDSGWRFIAGDEDEEYMDNPEYSGIYALNTLCNFDPEIIPFLESPFGSAFYRNEEGIFQAEEITE